MYIHFKVDFERQMIFWVTLQDYLNSLWEFLPEICLEEVTEEIFVHISFVGDVWPGAWTEASRLISQHTTYYFILE